MHGSELRTNLYWLRLRLLARHTGRRVTAGQWTALALLLLPGVMVARLMGLGMSLALLAPVCLLFIPDLLAGLVREDDARWLNSRASDFRQRRAVAVVLMAAVSLVVTLGTFSSQLWRDGDSQSLALCLLQEGFRICAAGALAAAESMQPWHRRAWFKLATLILAIGPGLAGAMLSPAFYDHGRSGALASIVAGGSLMPGVMMPLQWFLLWTCDVVDGPRAAILCALLPCAFFFLTATLAELWATRPDRAAPPPRPGRTWPHRDLFAPLRRRICIGASPLDMRLATWMRRVPGSGLSSLLVGAGALLWATGRMSLNAFLALSMVAVVAGLLRAVFLAAATASTGAWWLRLPDEAWASLRSSGLAPKRLLQARFRCAVAMSLADWLPAVPIWGGMLFTKAPALAMIGVAQPLLVLSGAVMGCAYVPQREAPRTPSLSLPQWIGITSLCAAILALGQVRPSDGIVQRVNRWTSWCDGMSPATALRGLAETPASAIPLFLFWLTLALATTGLLWWAAVVNHEREV